jgi:hypothetical protein
VKLPLWNKDDTNVLSEYQLTYGHIVCETNLTMTGEIERLCRCIGLGDVERVGSLVSEHLPTDPITGRRTLSSEQESHLIVAAVERCQVVFAPHKLFFSNRGWFNWNESTGGLMAYVLQFDVEKYFYTIFENGQRRFGATAIGNSITYIEDSPVEVYIDGKQVLSNPGAKPQVTEEIVALLASDGRIAEDDGMVCVRRLSSNELPKDVLHYTCRKAKSRWFCLTH